MKSTNILDIMPLIETHLNSALVMYKDNCNFFRSMGGTIRRDYLHVDSSVEIWIHEIIDSFVIDFSLTLDNEEILEGMYYLNAKSVRIQSFNGRPYNTSTAPHQLYTVVMELFKKHYSTLQSTWDVDHKLFSIPYKESDVIQVLDDCYTKYSCLSLIRSKYIEVTRGNVRLILHWLEDNQYKDVEFTFHYSKGRYISEMYHGEYNSQYKDIQTIVGKSPKGFSEGFKQFKLLIDLMN